MLYRFLKNVYFRFYMRTFVYLTNSLLGTFPDFSLHFSIVIFKDTAVVHDFVDRR
jgi:hypothetical protein